MPWSRAMSRLRAVACTLPLLSCLASPPAQAADRFVYVTNWYAQAEHGGFYQAQAKGLYARAGLDVTLKMGGPQVNVMQLMMAGQADCVMGFDVQTIQVWQQGVEAVTVAAAFQKDPVVMIARPQVQRIEELRHKTLMVGSAGLVTYWPWLKAKLGLSDAQVRPYNFNIQPFLAAQDVVQQGYLGSEPFSIEKQGGFRPKVFLLSDLGWPPYATTIVCMARTVRERPRQIAAFVKASMEGWKSYLQDDPGPAHALIRRDNPNMADDLLAHGRASLKAHGIVTGGDAATQGIGVITDARMKRTYDLLVQYKLLDPTKVDVRRTYTTEFVRQMRVLP